MEEKEEEYHSLTTLSCVSSPEAWMDCDGGGSMAGSPSPYAL